MNNEYKDRTAKIIRQNAKFARINYNAFHDKRLTKTEKDILSILSIMAGDKEYCWPTISYICRILDLNFLTQKRNVRRYLSKLERLGYIVREKRFDDKKGRQTSNKYHIRFPIVTLPTNRSYIKKKENIKERKRKEEFEGNFDHMMTMEHKMVVGESYHQPTSSRFCGLPLVVDDDSQDYAPMKFRMVKGWFRSLRKYNSPGEKSFLDIRTKTRPRNKNLPTKDVNNLTWRERMAILEEEERKMEEIYKELGVVIATHPSQLSPTAPYFTMQNNKMDKPILETVPPKLSTIIGDKPVDKIEVPKEEPFQNLKPPPTWSNICLETTKRNIVFQHWGHAYRFIRIDGDSMYIEATNDFYKDAFENRFKNDVKNACKFLGYTINVIDIKTKNN